MDHLRREEIKQFITELSRTFTPDQAITQDQLNKNHAQVHGGSWHYTVVAKLPAEMRSKITAFAERLYNADSTLVQYDPNLYHLTLCWFGADYDVETLTELIEVNLSKGLSFEIKDVMIAPYGIGIKAWPSNDSLITIRRAVYGSTGRFVPDLDATMDGSIETFMTSWVSIARFGPEPLPSSQQFVLEHKDELFGMVKPEGFEVYKVDNKYLQNAQLIGEIKNT
jgi:hypothetical protein